MNKYPTMTIEMTYVDIDNKKYTRTIVHHNVIKFVDPSKHERYYEITILTDNLDMHTISASKDGLISMKIW